MFKQHVTRTLIVGILGLAIALAIALVSPKVYEGRVEMLLGTGETSRNAQTVLSAEVEAILQRGLAGAAATERQLLTSQTVFFEAFQAAVTAGGQRDLLGRWNEFYKMYDVISPRTTTQESGASVVLIQARAYDPKLAAELANQIGTVYNDTRRANAREVVSDALAYVEAQMNLAKTDLDNSQDRYKKLKEEGAISDFATMQRDMSTKQTNLTQQIQNLEAQLAGVQATITEQQAALARYPKNVAETSADTRSPVIAQLETERERLLGAREQLLAVYLPDHVNVKSVDDQLAAIQKRLAAEKANQFVSASATTVSNPIRRSIEQNLAQARANEASFRSQLASLQGSLDGLGAETRKMAESEVALSQVARDLTIFDQKYGRLKTMAEELRTRAETGSRAAIVLSPAREDDIPIAPNNVVYAFVGLLAGLCAGLVLSFAWDALRVRVHSSAMLSEITGLPVLAAAPSLRTPARSLKAFAGGSSAPLETFRYLAFSLAPGAAGASRTLMFTGVSTPQGSANSALQTALALARTGTSVILVDADLARPALSKAFGAEGKPGLSNLLTDDAGALEGKEIGIATSHANLTLLPAGDRPLRALSDAAAARIEATIEALRKKADVVLIAAPPCDVLADASYIARYMDDVLLVVSGASPAHRAVPVAHDLLVRAGAQRVSLILTDAAPNEEPFGRAPALAKVD